MLKKGHAWIYPHTHVPPLPLQPPQETLHFIAIKDEKYVILMFFEKK